MASRGREEGCWLARRERPQRGRDRGHQFARWGRGERDAGFWCGNSPNKCVTMDRNWPSQGKGARMPACDEGTPPARDRNEPCGAEGRGMPACNLKQAAGMGHRWEGDEGCRLAKSEQPHAGMGHRRVREEVCRLANREQPQGRARPRAEIGRILLCVSIVVIDIDRLTKLVRDWHQCWSKMARGGVFE